MTDVPLLTIDWASADVDDGGFRIKATLDEAPLDILIEQSQIFAASSQTPDDLLERVGGSFPGSTTRFRRRSFPDATCSPAWGGTANRSCL